MKKPNFVTFILEYWRIMLAVVTSFGVTFAILIFKLDTLVGGYSNSELLMQSSPVSVQGIINNPIDILPKIIHYLTIKFSLDSLYFHRISNVVLATISATGVYLIVKSWHTTRIAIITTALMITSGWFLHVARIVYYCIARIYVDTSKTPYRFSRFCHFIDLSNINIHSITILVCIPYFDMAKKKRGISV